MNPSLKLQVGETKVGVWIAPGLVDSLGSCLRESVSGDRVAVLIDRTVDRHYGARIRKALKGAGWQPAVWEIVPPGERSKNLTRAQSISRRLLDAGIDRWTPFVAIGGGVVGDLGGYVASTFLRGLPLVHVPTTVVSQVDSSIGGKTGVNFGGG